MASKNGTRSTRRDFVKASGLATTAAALGVRAYAAPVESLRVGLVGCGGRGSGAAVNALTADPNAQLVAMADVFEDRAKSSLRNLQKTGVKDRVTVDPELVLTGFDAYKKVIDNVDVVILATPPHFRPMHLAYAVEKGVHSFVEKPVATDGPGVRSVLKSCELAKQKGLAVVSGLCWRYHYPKAETMKRVLDGELGPVVSIETVYNSTGVWEPRATREQCKSEMEYQMRNWYYYTWLSGDHIAEQAVHSLDKMGWAMGDEPPARCWGVGGRQVRTHERYGNIYDHFSLVYEYDNGVRGYHQCKHWRGTYSRVLDYMLCTEGTADVFGHRYSRRDGKTWRYRGPSNDMYTTEHVELFKSIRAGTPINNGTYMARSTLLAIMGREAAYTGQMITWDQALNSKQDLSPPAYEWGDIPRPEAPMPGITKFA